MAKNTAAPTKSNSTALAKVAPSVPVKIPTVKTQPLAVIHAAVKKKLSKYDEGLYDSYFHLYQLGADFKRRGLDYYWEVGQEFLSRLNNGKSKSEANAEVARVLCDSLRLAEGDVRIAMKFYKAYPSEKARDALKALHNEKGDPLSWSHLRRIVDVDDAIDRQKLIQLTLRNNWTVDELNHHLSATISRRESDGEQARTPRTGGAPIRIPKSAHAATAKFSALAKTFMANVREVYTRKDLIKQLADVETVDEATLAELDRQLAVVDEMGQYLEPMKKWFTELKGALATKASGTKALAEEDEDGVIDAEFEDKPADSDSEEEEEEEEDEEGDDSEDESEAESDDEPEDDSEEEEGDDSEDDSEEEEEEEEEEDEEDEEEEEEPAPPPKKKEKGKGDRKALIQKMHRQMKADKRAAAGAGKLRRV